MRSIKFLAVTLLTLFLVGAPLQSSAQTVEPEDLIDQPVICISEDQELQEPEELENTEECSQEVPTVADQLPEDDGRPEKGEVSKETVAGYEETSPQVLGADTDGTEVVATLPETGSSQLASVIVALVLVSFAILLGTATKQKASNR